MNLDMNSIVMLFSKRKYKVINSENKTIPIGCKIEVSILLLQKELDFWCTQFKLSKTGYFSKFFVPSFF